MKDWIAHKILETYPHIDYLTAYKLDFAINLIVISIVTFTVCALIADSIAIRIEKSLD